MNNALFYSELGARVQSTSLHLHLLHHPVLHPQHYRWYCLYQVSVEIKHRKISREMLLFIIYVHCLIFIHSSHSEFVNALINKVTYFHLTEEQDKWKEERRQTEC